jgi:hypothetical protein
MQPFEFLIRSRPVSRQARRKTRRDEWKDLVRREAERDDLAVAQRADTVRSALVHGFEATGLDQITEALARLAQQLLAELDQRVE